MFGVPQNSYVEILTFKVMILRDGPSEVIISHEDGALEIGISALTKKIPQS